ncbi:MAG: hypothetical protein ACOCTH_00865 [Halodesulfurarchaeum sp.]
MSGVDRVYISQATGTDLTVYHTSVKCPVLPGAYQELDRSLAEERGLRECHRCREKRFEVLEL